MAEYLSRLKGLRRLKKMLKILQPPQQATCHFNASRCFNRPEATQPSAGKFNLPQLLKTFLQFLTFITPFMMLQWPGNVQTKG